MDKDITNSKTQPRKADALFPKSEGELGFPDEKESFAPDLGSRSRGGAGRPAVSKGIYRKSWCRGPYGISKVLNVFANRQHPIVNLAQREGANVFVDARTMREGIMARRFAGETA